MKELEEDHLVPRNLWIKVKSTKMRKLPKFIKF